MSKRRFFFCVLIVTLTGLLGIAGCSALADNTNDISSGGFFAYDDGYMYFVTDQWMAGSLNDGRETGLPDSVEFWRIADVPGAQKELIASLPAAQIEGRGLNSGRYMVPANGSLYFVRDWPPETLSWQLDELTRLDIAAGTIEKKAGVRDILYTNSSPVAVSLPFFRDGDTLYFLNNNKETMKLDMQTDTVSPWNPAGPQNIILRPYDYHSEPGSIFEIRDGFIYYAETYQYDPEGYGISRMPIGGGTREIILPRMSEFENAPFCLVQGDRIYVFSPEFLYCVDIPSATVIDRIPADQEGYLLDNFYGSRINIADGKLYRLKEDGLYVKTFGADDEKRLISGNTEGIEGLTLGENYYYFHDSSRRRLFRVPVSARFMEEAEILLEAAPYMGSDQYQNENGWIFAEYENSVMILNYTGSETTAEAPATIHGKPVVCIGLNSYDGGMCPLQTLIIPEGVLRLAHLDAASLTQIMLPSSLLAMNSGGYPYVFEVADGCTVQYAGTCDEWQALDNRSWNDYSSDRAKEISIPVNCSDGAWTPKKTGGE